MMPPKNSPAYSPHCLDTEKKVKGQSQMYCECQNILHRGGEDEHEPHVLFLLPFSRETFVFWVLKISLRLLKIFISVFLSSFFYVWLSYSCFLSRFFYSKALCLLQLPHHMSKIKLIFIFPQSSSLLSFSILKSLIHSVSILIKRTWWLYMLSPYSHIILMIHWEEESSTFVFF